MKEGVKGFLKRLIPIKFHRRLKAIYRTYQKISYFGFRYKCPFCNSRLRTFLPYGLNFRVFKEKKVIGGGYRQNARCPVCGSFDRERLLYLYLLQKTDAFNNPKKLLHVAPESSVEDILRTKTNIDYLTADVASENVMVKMDVTDVQFPDGCFDAIICNHVLEHIIDDNKAMNELYRTLKPGGWAILQVPLSLTLTSTYEDLSITSAAGREQAFGQCDHVRIYAQDYLDRLREAGFEVNVFKWITEPENFGGQRNAFGLNKDECVCFASKHR